MILYCSPGKEDIFYYLQYGNIVKLGFKGYLKKWKQQYFEE
jgi:hypothetical protein